MVEQLLRTLAFQAGYNTTQVMMGTALLGASAGVVGAFAYLRKKTLLGDALAHCTLPGVAAAFLVAPLLNIAPKSSAVLLTGAAVATVVGVGAIHALQRFSRLPSDAVIAIALSSFFGLGIVLLSVIQSANTTAAGGLQRFIFGQAASLGRSDLQLLTGLAACCLLVVVLLYKELRLLRFDPEYADTQGWHAHLLDFILMALIVATTVAGLPSVGALLVVALLILPPVAARFWSERLSVILPLAAAFGALSCYVGAAYSSVSPNAPAGAVIVLFAGFVFLLSALFGPRRGLLSLAYHQINLRRKVMLHHLLRELYERCESAAGPIRCAVKINELAALRQHAAPIRWLLLKGAAVTGFVEQHGRSLELSERGLSAARALTRNHRLWEQYFLTYGALPASHVDYLADLAEHVLSSEVLAGLEDALRNAGSLPGGGALPISPHALSAPKPSERLQ